MTSTIGIPIKLLNEATVSRPTNNAEQASMDAYIERIADVDVFRATKLRLRSIRGRPTVES